MLKIKWMDKVTNDGSWNWQKKGDVCQSIRRRPRWVGRTVDKAPRTIDFGYGGYDRR